MCSDHECSPCEKLTYIDKNPSKYRNLVYSKWLLVLLLLVIQVYYYQPLYKTAIPPKNAYCNQFDADRPTVPPGQPKPDCSKEGYYILFLLVAYFLQIAAVLVQLICVFMMAYVTSIIWCIVFYSIALTLVILGCALHPVYYGLPMFFAIMLTVNSYYLHQIIALQNDMEQDNGGNDIPYVVQVENIQSTAAAARNQISYGENANAYVTTSSTTKTGNFY